MAFQDEEPLADLGELLSQIENQRADGGGSRLAAGLPFLEVDQHAEVRLGRVIRVEVVRQMAVAM